MAHAPMPPDELIRHAGFLRALGRRLLLDDVTIDDATQEAYVVGLDQGPREPSRGRGWLASVFRNAARQDQRASGRRRRREEAASRHEATEATIDAASRYETMRSVASAVTALPEPYQQVVLMRFYDGLPPREIAARTGVPVATVKSRLQRAIVRLRTDLDAGDGAASWRIGVAPIAGLGSSVVTGGVMSKANGWLVAVVILLVLGTGATLAWMNHDDPSEPTPEPMIELAGNGEDDAPPAPADDRTTGPEEASGDTPGTAPADGEADGAPDGDGKPPGPTPGRSPGGGVAGNHGGGDTTELDRVKVANLKLEDATVQTALQYLQVMTGRNFTLDPRAVDHAEGAKINLSLSNVSITTVLNLLADQLDMTWELKGSVVVVGMR